MKQTWYIIYFRTIGDNEAVYVALDEGRIWQRIPADWLIFLGASLWAASGTGPACPQWRLV